jgi:Peptidase family S41/N-terminal domain of Peptidase_S41 in eukaryotic IRBP
MTRETMMRRAAFALFLASVGGHALAQPAPGAQPQAQAPARIDPAAVVAEVRRVIAERYVLPERRPALDAVLADGLATGRYRLTQPEALADAINADLARVGHDRHLSFRYAPERARMFTSGRGEPDEAAYAIEARRRNFGVRELRLLPGNVRYMAYDGFDWTGAETARALETAMRFLSGGDAIIIDLRRNGGGSPEAVQYIVSHFMEANRPLMTFYMNGQATPDHTATLAEVPAGRMIGRPLYVLTSGRTASAAEEFVGHVAGYHLGELIGENTAVAGFRNQIVPVPGGFLLSVSVGRAVLAATGRDWEAVGHAPTVATSLDAALPTAQSRALRRLAASASPQDRPRLEATATMLDAQAHPVQTALASDAYAGRFGERMVRVENGRLTYQRGEGPKLSMIAIGPNAFTFEDDPATRIEYAVTAGAAASFEIIRPDGTRETQRRTP